MRFYGGDYGIMQCSGGGVSIEKEELVTDYTCYVGNRLCPKVRVTVKNNTGSARYVYVNVNFYYQGELACSESSKGVTLSSGDTYTFAIQSSYGTNYGVNSDQWTYKITDIVVLND